VHLLLAIDVGNTQTHLGAFRDGELVEHWRFATDRAATGDQLAAMLHQLLALRGLGFDDVEGEVLASVVPALVPEYRRLAERYLGREVLEVGPGVKSGMPIRLDNPRELGADRLVNAVAGFEQCRRACVVVDFGTALTYDAVSADGEYLGGIIAPGVEISLEALTSRAVRLQKVDLEGRPTLIGKTTDASVRSGIVYGFAAQVDGICRRLRGELGEEAVTIATGGLARVIVPFTETIDRVDDLLTLEGLRIVHERNR
jgi:type III pantothenate kinase